MGEFESDLATTYQIKLPTGSGTVARIRLWLTDTELHAVACYRFGQFARSFAGRNVVLGPALVICHRFWNRWLTHVDHVDISATAVIGPGLLIMHRHGLIVGPSVIGRNCVLYQNVTIGQRLAFGDHRVPKIGDDVWIGPNAIITGAITVGDGATISAGAVLSRDVPPRALVAGNPGRVIARDYDNTALVNPPDHESVG